MFNLICRGRKVILGLIFLLSALSGYAQNYRINERTRIYIRDAQGDSIYLMADNHFAIPVSLSLSIMPENLKLDNKSLDRVIPAGAAGYILEKIAIDDPQQEYRCVYNWRLVLGDVTRVPDIDYVYSYPYPTGADCKITQGPDGGFSHKNTFAYDFSMPVGSPVLAARDGVVAFVETIYEGGGADSHFMDKANLISILHSDGTIANYVHLKHQGAVVSEGQLVKKGELIGYSGNTGFTSGPHLHFEVVQPVINSDQKRMVSFRWDPLPQPASLTARLNGE